MESNLETVISDQSLLGRRIAITGAGRGLGRALDIVAADHGADIVLLGRDPMMLTRRIRIGTRIRMTERA